MTSPSTPAPPGQPAEVLNSEHGEAILEECARIVMDLFVQESRPPLQDCVAIARAVIEHAAPYLAADAHADGFAAGRGAADGEQR